MNSETHSYSGKIDFETYLKSEDESVGTMPVQAGILNPFGTIHAGAMIWFADVVATTLALQGVKPEAGMTGFPLAINLSANLVSNCKNGIIFAQSTYIKKGRRVSTIRTTVRSDQGKLLLDMVTSHVSS